MIVMLFAFILPIILTIVLILKYKQQTTFWEPLVPFVVVGLFIILLNWWGKSSITKDYEYWGNYITEVRYYEPWDEYIHQTCTRSCCCDSKGENCGTETYDCSYVDYHPAQWVAITNDGDSHGISKEYYDKLVRQFGTGKHFVDMHRDYHYNDGDMYYTEYEEHPIRTDSLITDSYSYKKFEPYFSKHSYENKVQASASVFNFPDVTEEDVKKYNLFEYPDIDNTNSLDAILTHGYKIPKSAQDKFTYINARLGLKKQVRVWVLLYNDNERSSVYMQRGYWKGGNKNELILCIGVNKDGTVAWFEPMGWAKNKLIEVETRNYILSKKLNLDELGDFVYTNVIKNWTRTSFGEFDYLDIEPPLWSIITTWILSIISCIGIAIWIINNEFTSDNDDSYNFN